MNFVLAGESATMKPLPYVVFVILGLTLSAMAADITATSCSQAAVQSAITSAASGDRVLVPAGACTWTTTVRIPASKGITLQGAGIDQTVITDTLANSFALELDIAAGNPLTRVTGFTFNANGIDKAGGQATIGVVASNSALDAFRIDTFKVINLRARGIQVNLDGFEVSGLIDSCTISAPFNDSAKLLSLEGSGPEDSTPFARGLALGTGKFIFVEDCTFNFTSENDGAIDVYTGGRYVFRHNQVNGTFIGHHGADSGNSRGTHSFEIYDNVFNSAGHNVSRVMYFRSGTGVVYNNTVTGNYSGGIEINNYRSCGNFPPWGTCDGTSSWDENKSGQQGYACLDQVGHVFTQNPGGSNTLEPLYGWNNTMNGSNLKITKVDIGNSCTRFLKFHMLENRDFYNGTPRPGYRAYPYPHPLRGNVPTPPSNLKVIVH
jgi:hypothetical protein